MVSLGQALSLRCLMLQSSSPERGQGKLLPLECFDERNPMGIGRSGIFTQLLFFFGLMGMYTSA